MRYTFASLALLSNAVNAQDKIYPPEEGKFFYIDFADYKNHG